MADQELASTSHEFQAEVAKLLQLMVHAVYSDREIFLRELISNASDACDRRRYEALTRPELLSDEEPAIDVAADSAAGTLTVSDSGIGMFRQELVENLGTIARSGTERFAKEASAIGDTAAPSLIGQFGIGFYAAFMVADRVTVISRRAGTDEAWSWQSDGAGAFTLAPAERGAAGTTITLRIKPDAREFLEGPRLRHIIRHYSNHVPQPVRLSVDGAAPETVNSATAIWQRPRSEISAQEYESFFRDVGGLYGAPLRTLHFRAEGRLEYTALLFTPADAPFDLHDPGRKSRVKLYVRRVFITDDCAALLPPYLRFLKGVVDAQDISLNISREMLQRDPVLASMKRAITGRVLSDYQKLGEQEPATYAKLWELYGPILKEGLYEDRERRTELLKLARFRSSGTEGWVSLDDYVGRMRDGQDKIYYFSGDTVSGSPQLEGYRARGVEVLLMSDPIDDFWVGAVEGYEGRRFASVTRAGADLEKFEAPDDGPERVAEPAMTALLAAIRAALGDKVHDVRASQRLTDSAVCLVSAEGFHDLRLEKLLRTHDPAHSVASRVLGINPRHAVIHRLAALVQQGGSEAAVERAANLLLGQAVLLEGEPLPEPVEFAHLLSRLLEETLRSA